MNTATAGRTLTQHRKVAVSFRDLSLLSVMKAALGALRYMMDNGADEKLLQEVGGMGGALGGRGAGWRVLWGREAAAGGGRGLGAWVEGVCRGCGDENGMGAVGTGSRCTRWGLWES
jgi:hypothetical protein